MSDYDSPERVLARQRDLEQSLGMPAGGHGVASGETVSLTSDELKARKRRNMWLGLAIVGFMLLVFAITMAKVGAGFMDRPI